jgi:hypothetical protein
MMEKLKILETKPNMQPLSNVTVNAHAAATIAAARVQLRRNAKTARTVVDYTSSGSDSCSGRESDFINLTTVNNVGSESDHDDDNFVVECDSSSAGSDTNGD